jgi:hypothetical protein
MNLPGHIDNAQIARLACPPQGITPNRAGISKRSRISFDESIQVSRSKSAPQALSIVPASIRAAPATTKADTAHSVRLESLSNPK